MGTKANLSLSDARWKICKPFASGRDTHSLCPSSDRLADGSRLASALGEAAASLRGAGNGL